MLLPRRDPGDTDSDWYRRVIYITIRVICLWDAAVDERPVHGTLCHHFNNMINGAKGLIVGEVAKHIEKIRIDRTGKLESFVVEKTAETREKEDNLANLTVVPTPAAQRGPPLETPRIQGPNSIART